MSDIPPKPKPVPKRHEEWHHVKGYFKVIVDDVFEAGGRTWVKHFITENCDDTHAEHEGAYAEQRLDVPLNMAKERFFESNHILCCSLDRFHRKFLPDPHPNPIKIPERKPPAKLLILKVTKS